jgi:hypothetical protein
MDAIFSKWYECWKNVNAKFEANLEADSSLHHMKNKKFHIWDGNHQRLASMPYIEDYHKEDIAWHC